MRLGRHLVEHDIASLILENPFYGRRRPLDGAAGHHRRRAARHGTRRGDGGPCAGRCAARPGRGRDRGFRVQHGRDHRRPGQLAFIWPAGDDPAGGGPLPRRRLHRRRAGQGRRLGGSWWTVRRDRLAEVLDWASVLRIAPPPHTATALLAAPSGDAYVPAHAVEALHQHWPGSELRWLPGGHVSVGLRGARTQAAIIAEGFTGSELVGFVSRFSSDLRRAGGSQGPEPRATRRFRHGPSVKLAPGVTRTTGAVGHGSRKYCWHSGSVISRLSLDRAIVTSSSMSRVWIRTWSGGVVTRR